MRQSAVPYAGVGAVSNVGAAARACGHGKRSTSGPYDCKLQDGDNFSAVGGCVCSAPKANHTTAGSRVGGAINAASRYRIEAVAEVGLLELQYGRWIAEVGPNGLDIRTRFQQFHVDRAADIKSAVIVGESKAGCPGRKYPVQRRAGQHKRQDHYHRCLP